jgi:hypothetical protein
LDKLGHVDCQEDLVVKKLLVEGEGKIGANITLLMRLSKRFGCFEDELLH